MRNLRVHKHKCVRANIMYVECSTPSQELRDVPCDEAFLSSFAKKTPAARQRENKEEQDRFSNSHGHREMKKYSCAFSRGYGLDNEDEDYYGASFFNGAMLAPFVDQRRCARSSRSNPALERARKVHAAAAGDVKRQQTIYSLAFSAAFFF